MSKHRSQASEIAHVRAEIKRLSKDEIYQIYGIILNEDGSVYDELEEETFPNLSDWLKFYVEESEEDEYSDLYDGEYDDDF